MGEQWTLDKDEVDRRGEEAARILHEGYTAKPDDQDWGMYTYGDASGAMGGGVGAFVWFRSRDELMGFVGGHLTFFAPGPHDIDPGRVAGEVRDIVDQIAAGEVRAAAGLERLNASLKHFAQIPWWGQLSELEAGDTEYSRNLRDEFREFEELEGKDLALKEGEHQAFLQFLSEYGV